MKKISLEIFKFAIVGTLGFLVDASILYALKNVFGLFYSRIISFTFAVFTTWLLNRSFTFSRKNKLRGSPWLELIYYSTLMLIGGFINITSYSYLLLVSDTVNKYPIIGVAVGSIAGMMFNFLSSKFFIYSKKK